MIGIRLFVVLNGIRYEVQVDLPSEVTVTLVPSPPPPGEVASVDFAIGQPQSRSNP